MDSQEFKGLMAELSQYIESEKVFIKNPVRFAEIDTAFQIASQLFSDSSIEIADDPLQMGALILRIECYDIVVRGQDEIALFSALIANADNFEIYPTSDDKIRFALVFSGALIRLPEGK